VELRTEAVARFQANAGIDCALADRISKELLPQLDRALDQSRQSEVNDGAEHAATALVEFAKTRKESWQLLAEALRESDAEKLKRHSELWMKSAVLGVGVMATKRTLATPTPAQSVDDFKRALVTFTPHLIATPTLVLANVLIFVAMIATGVDFLAPTPLKILEWGANFGPKTMNGQWWRLVTCMFLHFGILHLGFNMWVLWELGRLVERLVGNVGFVLLYFVSGIAGSIASLAWNPVIVAAGASGAVFGVAGALLGVLSFHHDTVPAVVLKRLRNSMAFFLIFNFYYGAKASGIDMAAHIGGLTAGFACGLILRQPFSVNMVAGRKLRNAAVLVTGAVVLPLAAVALPSSPPDFGGELQRFAEMEKLAIDTNNELARRSQRGEVGNASFAEALDRDVLPPWIESRKRIERLIDAPGADRALLSRLLNYMKAREEGWQLRVECLRNQDLSKCKRADERSTEADKMAKELSAK
jgi:rhomboid protease GluP